LLAAALNAWPSLKAYQPIPRESQREVQQSLTPEEIQHRALRTTVYDEYLPAGANVAIVRRQEGTVLFRKWAFPVWTATVNERPAAIENCSGIACVRVADDNARVSLDLREPTLRRWCKAVSGCTMALLLVIAVVQYGSKWKPRPLG